MLTEELRTLRLSTSQQARSSDYLLYQYSSTNTDWQRVRSELCGERAQAAARQHAAHTLRAAEDCQRFFFFCAAPYLMHSRCSAAILGAPNVCVCVCVCVCVYTGCPTPFAQQSRCELPF